MALRYLESLCTNDHVPLADSRRRIPTMGFKVTVHSIRDLCEHLIQERGHSFFLTYKTSQDHLEILFSKIRQRGGFNNNPSVQQFKTAFKSLLINNLIKPSRNANVMADDTNSITDFHLDFRSSKRQSGIPELKLSSDDEVDDDTEFRYSCWMSSFQNCDSDWRLNILFYVSGYVAKRCQRFLDCSQCNGALFESDEDSMKDVSFTRLFSAKQRGGLSTPSFAVYSIVKIAEVAFRSLFPGVHDVTLLPTVSNIDLKIEHFVLQKVDVKTLFPTLFADHFYDHDFHQDSDHLTKLIRLITSNYVKIRLFRYGKIYFERNIFNSKVLSRQQAMKLILFRGK